MAEMFMELVLFSSCPQVRSQGIVLVTRGEDSVPQEPGGEINTPRDFEGVRGSFRIHGQGTKGGPGVLLGSMVEMVELEVSILDEEHGVNLVR